MAHALEFVSSTILLRCRHCGGGLPVQGPLRKVPCPACQELNDLGASRLVEYLRDIADGSKGFLSGVDGEVRFGPRDSHPCSGCGAKVPLEGIALGEESATPCAKCGTVLESFPPPKWLAEELPSLVQLYGATREPGDRPAGALPLAVPKAAEPVVMKCPSCSAGLEITPQSRRTTACTYCKANVYLPDDLWRLMHPVETTRTWSWSYRAPLKSKLDLHKEENLRRNTAREAAKREEERERKAEQYALKSAIERREHQKKLWGAILIVGLALAALAGWIVGGKLGYWNLPDFSSQENDDPRDTGWVG